MTNKIKVVSMIAIVLTFLLINLGGLVHNTESSLACPDWPLCYGQVFPKMEGGVLIEHSHRLLATLVGCLSIALLFMTRSSNLFKFSLIALFLVIFQGVLGGLTVIFKLPTMISTGHLATSMIFFATLIYLHHKNSNFIFTKNIQVDKKSWNKNIKLLVLASLVLVFLQMLLGALMRHLGLGSACGLGFSNSIMCFDSLTWVKTWFPVGLQSQIHMAHRLFGFIVGAFVTYTFTKLYTFYKKNNFEKKYAVYPIVFVLFQVVLGILSVTNNIGIISTTLHLGVSALLFATIFKNNLFLSDLETTSNLKNTYSKFLDILSLTKPRLSLLVIFTSALGLFLAPGNISLFRGILAVLSTSGLVAGACILNCYMEIDRDLLMKRTMDRPLPQNRLNPEFAFKLGMFLTITCLFVLFFKINLITGILGLIATFTYLFLYTPLKPKTNYSLFAGAIPGAIPPLMGWTAVMGTINSFGAVLFAILFFWQVPHFLAIAIFHFEDYKKAGFITLPQIIGFKNTAKHISFYSLVLFMITLIPYWLGVTSLTYLIFGLILGSLFFIYSTFGFRLEDGSIELKNWAKRFFYSTLVYLPCVFVLMICFK